MHAARLSCLLLLAGAATAQGRIDVPDRSWTQAQGNAFGSSWADVEPLRSEPEVAWSTDLGVIVAEPVTWGSTAFVAVKKDAVQIWAVNLADGAVLGTGALGKESPSSLFAWDGAVGAVLPSGVVMLELDAAARKLTESKRFSDVLAVPPRLVSGVLFGDSGAVKATALKNAAVRGGFEGTRGPAALRLGGAWGPPAYASLRVADGVWSLRVVEVDDLGAIKLNVLGQGDTALGSAGPELLPESTVARLQPAGGAGAWLVSRPDGSWLVGEGAGAKVSAAPFSGGVAVARGAAFGFDASGAFVRLETSGSVSVVVPADGGVRGPVTIARDVAYAGGRAIDLASGKVLWSSRKLAPERRALPAADQRVLAVEGKGKLICLGGKASRKPVASAAPAGPSRPGSGDGLVRADGTRIAGTVTQTENGWRVEDEGGRVSELSAADVALVESGGTVKLEGDEEAVYRAFQASLNVEHAARLTESFALYLKPRLVEDCRRLLDEAKKCGLEKGKLDELDAKLKATKPNENSNKEGQRKAPLAKEQELRKASRVAWGEAADWCLANQMALAATLLHVDSELRAPAEGSADAALTALLPAAFPWREQPDAVARWKRWAPKLIRSGATFVPKDDPAWRRIRSGAWVKGAIVLRTRNITLFSREDDPSVVGECLDAAEFAVRLLRRLVPPAPDAFDEPLAVRLLYDREEYLKEPAGGGRPPEWSAGLYSGGVSRFYVRRGDEAIDPLGRGVFSVVSHELTHHYLDAAWLAKDIKREQESNTLPGYWIVEGIARFVEDEVAAQLSGRSGRSQRDAASAYVCKQAQSESQLFKAQRLIDMTAGDFAKLGNETLFNLPLPEDGTRALLITERHIFYEQSGSLVFFLMYRAGPEARVKLVEYLLARYLGKTTPEGWKALGYAAGEELDAAYRRFLEQSER